MRGEAASPVNLANALTVLRIVLAPVFLVLYVQGERIPALVVFAAAALSDALDGVVARLLRQQTRIGALLDPVADKLLTACALLALAATGRLPWSLPALVVGRDAAQLVGASILKGIHHRVPIAPSRIGKYAMVAIALTVVVALASDAGAFPGAEGAPWVVALALLAMVCVAISCVQYSLYFVRSARRLTPPQGAL